MLLNLTELFAFQAGHKEEKEIVPELEVFKNGAESYKILQKTPVSFVFTNLAPGRVRVEGKAEVVLKMQCSRCLKDVEQEIQLSFAVDVVSPEVPLEEADDQTFMEGYQLNVESLFSNEILMNLPTKVLCRPDCKGICWVCGKDLNLGECGCDTFVPDPRMAAIKDIFNANKEV